MQEARMLKMQQATISRRVERAIDSVRQGHDAAVTYNIERLTKIPFIFVPLTTVATILSIEEKSRFAWFILIATPLVAICIYIGNIGRKQQDS
jgi:hypothetical protein